jgi:hypothetical protein
MSKAEKLGQWWGGLSLLAKFIAMVAVLVAIAAIAGGAHALSGPGNVPLDKVASFPTAATSAKTTAATSTVANRSPEWQLAFIQSNDPSLSDSDPLVAAFARHLDSLEAKTTNARSHIADITVNCWQTVNAEGFDDSLMRVIQELDTSVPNGLHMELSEVAAAWVLLRIK